jgi:phospholipid/cholesterol/gamma-HCH transport system permease protein
MLPLLTLYADAAGVIAGYLVASAMGVPPGGYFQAATNPAFIRIEHVLLGLAKTLVFGAIIALVSCQQGLRTRGGAAGVGHATTNAVVLSIMLIYVVNYFLSEMMFIQ